MTNVIDKFYDVFFNSLALRTVYLSGKTPKEMMASQPNDEGWFSWKPIKGNLQLEVYEQIEQRFKVKFPKSFVEWHRAYYFLRCDCSILSLPSSNPIEPLQELVDTIDYDLSEDLIAQKLYPFAEEGNDGGPLVFDGRLDVPNNEFPIRFYDHEYGGDLDGLSEVIFSSFPKLLECVTYFLEEVKTRKDYEIIPHFLTIDPLGAGKSGIDYWLGWSNMLKETDEYFKND